MVVIMLATALLSAQGAGAAPPVQGEEETYRLRTPGVLSAYPNNCGII